MFDALLRSGDPYSDSNLTTVVSEIFKTLPLHVVALIWPCFYFTATSFLRSLTLGSS